MAKNDATIGSVLSQLLAHPSAGEEGATRLDDRHPMETTLQKIIEAGDRAKRLLFGVTEDPASGSPVLPTLPPSPPKQVPLPAYAIPSAYAFSGFNGNGQDLDEDHIRAYLKGLRR